MTFWLTMALIFGLLAKRPRALSMLVALATLFVVTVVIAVAGLAPMFGWRLLLDAP